MKAIDFEQIIIRKEVTSRGGGIEISLDTLGYEGEKMTAYQNYLGGGMLGRVASDCTRRKNDELEEIAEQLRKYFHLLTNPDEETWVHTTYEQNQNLTVSAY